MKTSVTALIIWLNFTIPLVASADCTGFGKYGVYDVSTNLTQTEQGSAFRNWYCSRQFQSSQQANKSSAEIGIPLDDVPFKLGFSNQSKNFGEWQGAYCSDQYNSSTDKKLTESYVATVNDKVLKVISECMKQPGVHAMVEQGAEPLVFRFTALYVPYGSERFPTVVSFSTSASPPLDCEKDKQISKGQPISTSGINLLCKRRHDEAIDVVFNTTAPRLFFDTPTSIRAAPPPPPPSAMVKAEACHQLFSGPYDLESITKLYSDRLKLYRDSLIAEEKEIRGRFPGADASRQQTAFQENKRLADDVRRDIDSRIGPQIDATDWLVDTVKKTKKECGASTTYVPPVDSNPASGRCQSTLLDVGADTLSLYRASVPMADTISFWQNKRNESWRNQPEPDRDPSLHIVPHGAARDQYQVDQKSMDLEVNRMIDDGEKLKESLIILPDTCRF